MKKLFNILLIYIYISGSSLSLADNKINIQTIYKLLQEKKFEESIQNLEFLSNQNDINAQLLYSKILFSGDITPQDFEKSYFWAFSALLGGKEKSSNIIKKLENYLTKEQVEEITNKLREFLEKRTYKKDKRAIIQIAKLYETYIEPPDFINAYTWYNIAVAQGIKSAKSKRDEVLDKLNDKDLLDAQALSIKLFKKINN